MQIPTYLNGYINDIIKEEADKGKGPEDINLEYVFMEAINRSNKLAVEMVNRETDRARKATRALTSEVFSYFHFEDAINQF